MAIRFETRTVDNTEGEDTFNIPLANPLGGAAMLRGFYMSYGADTNHDVKEISATIGADRISGDGKAFSYSYTCSMRDRPRFDDAHDDFHEAKTVKLRITAIFYN